MSDTQRQVGKDLIGQKDNNNKYVVDFVFERDVFSNVFHKDIKRVYFYKKGERLAKAIHWVLPAFEDNAPLSNRLKSISVALVDSSLLTPREARDTLVRELLMLRSLLSLAENSGIISSMNAGLIIRECENFIREVGLYDDPKLMLPPVESIADVARETAGSSLSKPQRSEGLRGSPRDARSTNKDAYKRQVSSKKVYKGHKINREVILDILRSKGRVFIKDISTIIRDVSEKTIQRELASMLGEGIISREGERRWTSYSLAGSLVPETSHGA